MAMTITPISQFGNTSTSSTGASPGAPTGAGGFAAFFAALLGGGIEGVSETEGQPEGLSGLLGLLSSKGGIEGGNLGAALKTFMSAEGGDLPLNFDVASLGDFDLQTQSLDSAGNPFLKEGDGKLKGLLNAFSEGKIVYEEIFAEVRKTAVSLQASVTDFSEIKGVDGLAKAYEMMGLGAEEALEKATNVVTAIAVMKERFDIEIAGEEKPNLISTIFNMASEQGDVFSSEMTFTQINMQMSRSVIAFEASSTLSSGDIGMTVLKGEPLQSLIRDAKPIGADVPKDPAALLKSLDSQAESTLEDGFVPLKTKDIPTMATKVADSMAQVKPSVAGEVMDKMPSYAPEGIFASSVQKMAADERQDTKRQVTHIAADKVLKIATGENLFTVKPQTTGENKGLELETAAGEIVDMENMNENFDEVMDVVTRRTALDGRVEGRSQPAIVKQANIAGQADIQMKNLVKQGGGQVRFRLDPAELGELDVKLNISRGTVRGTIIVQSIEVAESLARDLRILQQSFEEAGLELHEEGIKFKLQEDMNQGQEQQNAGRGGNGTNDDESDDGFINVGSAEEEAANWVKPDSLLDVSV
ncbi:MAG: hypothetical protein ACI9TY_001246 [Alphaproteobacteria bacterium]|jgi:hypothetical protein